MMDDPTHFSLMQSIILNTEHSSGATTVILELERQCTRIVSCSKSSDFFHPLSSTAHFVFLCVNNMDKAALTQKWNLFPGKNHNVVSSPTLLWRFGLTTDLGLHYHRSLGRASAGAR